VSESECERATRRNRIGEVEGKRDREVDKGAGAEGAVGERARGKGVEV
jgi:hypothetical protein